jgi:hypothetical protein
MESGVNRCARIATLALSLLCASGAYAGPYTDDLSKCVVKATTPDDQIVFMQWMFSALTLHPAVSNLTSMTPEQRAAFQKKAADLFVRLLTVDCRQQALDAAKYEGGTAIATSFQLFGGAAMRGLTSNPEVAAGMQGLGASLQHNEKWLALLHDAGLPSH